MIKMKKKIDVISQISGQLRVMCFDIGTSMQPHSDCEQEIITIHASLYNEYAHSVPFEHRTFYYVPKLYQGGSNLNSILKVNKKNVIDFIYNHIGNKVNPNMTNENYEIICCNSELHLLHEFMNCVKACQINVITHYCGNNFDLPFVKHRMEVLNYRGMKLYNPGNNFKRFFMKI